MLYEVITELNGVGDNPIFFPDDNLQLSGANFQGSLCSGSARVVFQNTLQCIAKISAGLRSRSKLIDIDRKRRPYFYKLARITSYNVCYTKLLRILFFADGQF